MLIKQQQLKNWESFVFYPNYFTPSECEAIIHMAKNLQPTEAYVGKESDPVRDKKIRSSEVRWMKHSKKAQWIFDKLEAVSIDVRDRWYPFSLSGFNEPLQITRYLASEGGHYSMHRDFGGMPCRTENYL